ncbi:cadmium transporter [Bifidobacterium eulemuris]|uniref:Cadmium transporter n=1 Tax=Bifidobacterium eulemuris TaxID=1765219 RepID=A0A261GC09_9BIFI|nr:cadmium transporter [Bifidobacterium eulemuris]OZG68967.1 cadmium transporter [Bifidobacterium eulemuris]QOL31499.1 cadmium transporter [Bifidobacterium eulemuris]
MPSNWMDTERTSQDAMPTMLAQAAIVAATLCVGEIACSPLYFNLLAQSVALVPWALMACFIAVAFSYIIGFALLWCSEAFTNRMRDTLQPFAYAAVGLIGYGVWGLFVFTSSLNSVLEPLAQPLLSNGQVVAVTVNSGALGAVAFFLARMLGEKLAVRRTPAIALIVAEAALAVAGLAVMVIMFRQLY